MAARIQAYGPKAFLLTLDTPPGDSSLARLRAIAKALEDRKPPGLSSLTFGYVTLLAEFDAAESTDGGASLQAATDAALEAPDSLPLPESKIVQIPIRYNGPDLELVARHTGMPAEEVVRRHSAPLYRVHFLGFAPGFAYITGMDPALATPRLEKPRPRVEAGSVGIGGLHTGVYPVATPGGWNLIGRACIPMFDPNAASDEDMFLLNPLDRIQFVVSEAEPISAAGPGAIARREVRQPILKVIKRGVAATLQDGGRRGRKQFGVPPGGALDKTAMRFANLLVGNPSEAPVIEAGLGGQRFQALQAGWIGVAGADLGFILRRAVPQAPIPVRPWQSIHLNEGDILESRERRTGVWAYISVAGGFKGQSHLGSVGGDSRAGLGCFLHDGDHLESSFSGIAKWEKSIDRREIRKSGRCDYASLAPLRVWAGPQMEWFGEENIERFFRQSWRVSAQSDRSGYRLEAEEHQRLRHSLPQLISEPTLVGSIQVPPSGKPIITLNDGPTVGGYPKLGLLDEEDLAMLVQTAPGGAVQFRLI